MFWRKLTGTRLHLSKPKTKIKKKKRSSGTLYIHTSEWLKLSLLLQLLFSPIQRSRHIDYIVSPPGLPLLYPVLVCFYLDYVIPSILSVVIFCLFICLLVFSQFIFFFFPFLLFFGLCSPHPLISLPLLSFTLNLLPLSTKSCSVTNLLQWIFSNLLKYWKHFSVWISAFLIVTFFFCNLPVINVLTQSFSQTHTKTVAQEIHKQEILF